MTEKEMIQELKDMLLKMDARVKELEAGASAAPAAANEATDADLFYLLHNHGYEAYKQGLKERNRLRKARKGRERQVEVKVEVESRRVACH